VRELESIIAHAVIMADTHIVRAQDLPDVVRDGTAPRLAIAFDSRAALISLTDMEDRHIRMVLENVNGNQTQAAKILGISRSTLWRKMGEYGIQRDAG
jgi:transcriptional regulator of acetoin/glycerol metabolism